MKLYSCFLLLCLCVVFSGCSVKRALLGEVVRKNLVCLDELSCKSALAKDCPKGGKLHGVLPAIVVQYSCNP